MVEIFCDLPRIRSGNRENIFDVYPVKTIASRVLENSSKGINGEIDEEKNESVKIVDFPRRGGVTVVVVSRGISYTGTTAAAKESIDKQRKRTDWNMSLFT